MFTKRVTTFLGRYVDCGQSLRLFEMAMCLWVLIHAFKLIGAIKIIESPFSFCPEAIAQYPWGIDFILTRLGQQYFGIAVALQALCAGYIVFRGSNFLSRAFLWLTHINIICACSSIGDGGTNLFSTLMLVFIFCDVRAWSRPPANALVLWVRSALLFSMQFQVVVVYLQAALSKVRSDGWSSGVALYYILQIPEFSEPLLAHFIVSNDWLVVMLTYATIAFQLTFLFAMLQPVLRPWWLLFGTIFHIGIAFSMGLMSFALMMVSTYAIFLTNAETTRIMNLPRRLAAITSPGTSKF
jgi:hypothetical protein